MASCSSQKSSLDYYFANRDTVRVNATKYIVTTRFFYPNEITNIVTYMKTPFGDWYANIEQKIEDEDDFFPFSLMETIINE